MANVNEKGESLSNDTCCINILNSARVMSDPPQVLSGTDGRDNRPPPRLSGTRRCGKTRRDASRRRKR